MVEQSSNQNGQYKKNGQKACANGSNQNASKQPKQVAANIGETYACIYGWDGQVKV